MFKKSLFLFAAMFLAVMPACAVKQFDLENNNIKVTISDTDSAVVYRVVPEKGATTIVQLSNLDCNEYKMKRTYRTSNGIRYIKPAGVSWEVVNKKPWTYVNSLINQNRNNIYFKAQGIGLGGVLIGEIYINGVNLAGHLVEKGYCTYIK